MLFSGFPAAAGGGGGQSDRITFIRLRGQRSHNSEFLSRRTREAHPCGGPNSLAAAEVPPKMRSNDGENFLGFLITFFFVFDSAFQTFQTHRDACHWPVSVLEIRFGVKQLKVGWLCYGYEQSFKSFSIKGARVVTRNDRLGGGGWWMFERESNLTTLPFAVLRQSLTDLLFSHFSFFVCESHTGLSLSDWELEWMREFDFRQGKKYFYSSQLTSL